MPGLLSASKKALLIACQYERSLAQHGQTLQGAHNDPRTLSRLLIDCYGYKKEDITILMDDEEGQYAWPTRENILAAMKELVKGVNSGDHLVFSFSGHGAQIPNEDGTEEDGYDETLIAADTAYDSEKQTYSRYIKDDDVRTLLVDSLPSGAHMVMIFDCCHSGTASDLPAVWTDKFSYSCSPISTRRGYHTHSDTCYPQATEQTHSQLASVVREDMFTSEECKTCWLTGRMGKSRFNSLPVDSHLPDVTSWSACLDNQVTYGGRRTGGMFIKAFSDALGHNPHQTHAQLLHSIRLELARKTSTQTFKLIKKGEDTENMKVISPKAQLSSLKPLSSLCVPFDM
ncbi:peptidase C14, caspase domain-containing protein [Fomes fomentarius]|nr:peptidase C14, caspase domain-containing protein [Fomes fomentarius]